MTDEFHPKTETIPPEAAAALVEARPRQASARAIMGLLPAIAMLAVAGGMDALPEPPPDLFPSRPRYDPDRFRSEGRRPAFRSLEADQAALAAAEAKRQRRAAKRLRDAAPRRYE